MRLNIHVICLAAALLIAGSSGPAGAKIVLAPLFTDNAVLQQKQADPVWGTADPNETVNLTINGQSVKTVAGADGKWSVRLKPMNAGGPFTLAVTGSPGDAVTLNNILIGEVWICGGQSNMEFSIYAIVWDPDPKKCVSPNVTLDNCADPLLHFAMVKNNVGLAPLSTADAQWKEVRPDTAGWLSATGYFFGRELRKTLNVPVGIINDNWGGTPAQAWMSRGALEANPDFKHYLDEEAAYAESYPRMLDNFNAKQASYLASKAAGTVGTAPAKPDEPAKWKAGAAHLYNGMIAPVIPYGIKGAIWYQGESNAGRAFEYRTLFPALIADWRKNWGEGEFPFLYVQLAPTYAISPKPVDGSGWAEIREAQRLTLATVPNTAMAVITDVGDQNTVHPKRKEPVGHRLALAARALVYMENTECTGPVLRGASVDGSKIRVSFTHAQGLHAIEVHDVADNGPMLAGADKLAGFEIAGADRKYHAADAAIDGTSVVVSSPDVPTPVAVRYAWANYPVANLSNGAGLPASPFKTDDWPWSTQPKP